MVNYVKVYVNEVGEKGINGCCKGSIYKGNPAQDAPFKSCPSFSKPFILQHNRRQQEVLRL